MIVILYSTCKIFNNEFSEIAKKLHTYSVVLWKLELHKLHVLLKFKSGKLLKVYSCHGPQLSNMVVVVSNLKIFIVVSGLVAFMTYTRDSGFFSLPRHTDFFTVQTSSTQDIFEVRSQVIHAEALSASYAPYVNFLLT